MYLFGFRADYYKDGVLLQSKSVTNNSNSSSKGSTHGASVNAGSWKNVRFTIHDTT